MKILLFGGTTEGRVLAQHLSRAGVEVVLSVATGYGAALAPEGPGLRVLAGRMEEGEMEALLGAGAFDYVVDATHPYAAVVTRNVQAAAEGAGVPYLRLVREGAPEGDWLHAPDMAGAAALAAELPGNVLLTTGAKELASFAVPGLLERCFPRVLPTLGSLERCLELGFPAAHVVCMQGPFSKELDLALLRQFGAKVLVTKASGGVGGFWEKVESAREAGCALIVVDRPAAETGLSLDEMESFLLEGSR